MSKKRGGGQSPFWTRKLRAGGPPAVIMYTHKKVQLLVTKCHQEKSLTTKTSLLRRLQTQTLADASPPIGKIYPFTKMAVPFEPVMQF